tara:strand:+ start:1838 stop:2050 length:213 start_codon:yes stop_codon:yes gene_type:complete
MEKLDIANIIEINKIRALLINHPDLLSLLEILIIICNNRINEEQPIHNLPLENNVEPELSDHSSDESDDD